MHLEAHAVLLSEPPLDLSDVLARAQLLASERENGEVGGGQWDLRPLGVAGVVAVRLAASVEPLVAAGRETGALMARV